MQRFFRFCQVSFFALVVSVWFSSSAIAPALAHWADLTVADVIVTDTQAQITLTIPTVLLAFVDDDGNHTLSQKELETHQSQLEQYMGKNIVLTNQTDTPGNLTLTPANTQQPQKRITHSTFLLDYVWPVPLKTLSISYNLFSPEINQVKALATITEGDHTRNVVFTPENNTVNITGTLPWQQQFLSFLRLGIEHIFTGYDHILFLLALLLPGGRLPQLLKIVTAFTIAHSLTLTLAALNLVTLPAAVVESIIALSIVYIAIENLWQRQQHINHRPWLTFGFGLIHGLGFANILRDLTQSQSNLILSLASFNLGVEIGQATIVIVVFYGLRLLHKQQGELIFRYGVSVLMILMGSVWFAERALAAWV